MNRRTFIRSTSVVTASGVLAGCTEFGTGADDGNGGGDADDADVSVTVVRNAPENPGPYEDPAGTVTARESDALALDGFVFQRAGEKGLAVSGDATNTADSPLADVTVEVTLYDENETADEIFDSAAEQAERGRLGTGESWQWAATFDEEPTFQIDYYAVAATASYA